MKTQDIFGQFLAIIQDKVSPILYSTWFQGLKLIKMDDKEVVIQVPLPIHKTILTTTHLEMIEETFYSLTNKTLKIRNSPLFS